mmetsp:Transcript_27174/g.68378  ORF Transcript_27174/g.68378 Transcript_27174/m.68378 type:complete len:364 (-) Transcript_27174:37-1128(-)
MRLHAVEYLLPVRLVACNVLRQLVQLGADVGQAAQLAPGALLNPVRRQRHVLLRHADAARQQEGVLLRVQLALAHQDARVQQEGEQQLVLLKQRAADVLIKTVREEAVDVAQPLLQVVCLGAALDGAHKEADEPAERVLVHGVDACHVAHAEEEHGVVGAAGAVPHARGIDLLPRLLRHNLLLLDLVAHHLGLAKDLDGGGVLQDVALAGGEDVQDAVLDLLQLALVLRALHNQLLPLALQVRPLLCHHHPQQLVAQPLLRDHEVEQRHLDRRLGEVVRVAQRGGDVEAERVAELHGRVTHADVIDAALLEDLLQQQRLQAGVQLLAHVLQQHGDAELHRVLQRAQVVAIGELDDAQVLLLLH